MLSMIGKILSYLSHFAANGQPYKLYMLILLLYVILLKVEIVS